MSANSKKTSIVDSVLGFLDRRGFLGGTTSKQEGEQEEEQEGEEVGEDDGFEEQKIEDRSVTNRESQQPCEDGRSEVYVSNQTS